MKPLTYIALIILFTFKGMDCTAQLSKTNPQYKRANNWIFGQGIHLDISTNPPIVKPRIPNFRATEGSSCISDMNGNLQFYHGTSNDRVRNGQRVDIINSKGVLVYGSSTQATLIVNHPENDSIFYLFTVPQAFMEDVGLRVNVINKFNGMDTGEIIIQNKKLLPKSTEKLTAINHQNGKDVWVIAHGFTSNSYFAFLLTKDGLLEYPIESQVGNILDIPVTSYSFNSQGYIRFSNNGELLANAILESKRIEIFDFNNQLGLLTLNSSYNTPYDPYGLCFSTDSRKLFFQIVSSDSSYVGFIDREVASTTYLYKKKIREIQSLQNNGRGEIYIAFPNTDSLGLIQDPNGTPTFTKNGVSTAPYYATHGLPNFNQSYLHRPSVEFFYTLNCNENSIELEGKDSFYATSFKWYVQNTKTLNTDTILTENHNYFFKDTGEYKLTYIASKAGKSDTIEKNIKVYPSIEKDFLGNDTFYCKGVVFSHSLKVPERLHSWHWGEAQEEGVIPFTGDKTLLIDTAGIYTATLVTKNFCVLRDTLEVIEHTPVVPTIKNEWDSLYSEQSFTAYTWYKDGKILSGETKDRIGLKATGNYELKGTDVYGCSAISSIKSVGALSTIQLKNEQVIIYPNPTDKELIVELKGNYIIELYNTLGTLILTKSANNKTILDIENLPKGLYLIKIVNNNHLLHTQKIIKN